MSKLYKYTSGILVALIALVINACSGDDFSYLVSKYRVSADTSEVTLGGAQGATAVLKITADCAWTLTKPSGATWLDMSATNGNGDAEVTLTNNTISSAETSITLVLAMSENSAIKQSITLTRQAGTSSITLSASEKSFGAVGGDFAFTVTCQTDSWEISKISESWLHIPDDEMSGSATGTSGATVNVTVDPNTGDARDYTIVVTNVKTTETATLKIVQSEYSMSIEVECDAEGIEVPAAGGEYSLTVRCTDAWKFNPNGTWYHIVNANGATVDGGDYGNYNLTLVVEPNTNASARNGKLLVEITGHEVEFSRTVSFTQASAGDILQIADGSSDTYEFDETGGSKSANILTNLTGLSAWTDDASSDWCSPAYDSANSRVTMDVLPNTTASERRATVYVGNSTQNIQITVVQAPGTIPTVGAVSITNIGQNSFTAIATFESVQEVYAAGFQIATSEAGLANAEMRYGSIGSNQVALDITGLEANTTYYVRAWAENPVGVGYTASGDYTSTQTSDSSIAVADGYSTTITFEREGGTETLPIEATAEWEVTSNDTSWCTASRTGSNLVVSATQNDSSAERSTTVVLTATSGNASLTVTVIQAGAAVPGPDDNTPPNP